MFNPDIVVALLGAIVGNDQSAARSVAQAIQKGLSDAGLLEEATPAAPVCPPVEYNKMRTLHKDYGTAGFSDESLTVTLKTRGNHDVLIISAGNKFRSYYQEISLREGFHVDRSTIGAQLRLGVLKVTGRTYKTKTPVCQMDLSNKTIIPVMKPNRG